MCRVLVVLRDPLPNLGRCDANNGIGRGVVVSVTAEDFDAERALFYVVDVTRQSVFDNEAEEVGKAAAVIEERTGEETVQLIADRFRARYLDHELIFTHGSLRYIRLDRLRL